MDYFTLTWIVSVLYIFIDVNYFIRSLFTIVYGFLFHKRCRITDTTKLYGICFTNDVDMMICHMNNARYLRELDFARYHFYERTGLFKRLFNARTITLQTGTCMRYRQSISLFAAFEIQTKMVYWDNRNVYLEHQFVTTDGCVRAICLSRQTILSGTIPSLFSNYDEDIKLISNPPQPNDELKYWMASMEASSQTIKISNSKHSLQEHFISG